MASLPCSVIPQIPFSLRFTRYELSNTTLRKPRYLTSLYGGWPFRLSLGRFTTFKSERIRHSTHEAQIFELVPIRIFSDSSNMPCSRYIAQIAQQQNRAAWPMFGFLGKKSFQNPDGLNCKRKENEANELKASFSMMWLWT